MTAAFLTAIIRLSIIWGPAWVNEFVYHIVEVDLIELLIVARARAVLGIWQVSHSTVTILGHSEDLVTLWELVAIRSSVLQIYNLVGQRQAVVFWTSAPADAITAIVIVIEVVVWGALRSWLFWGYLRLWLGLGLLNLNLRWLLLLLLQIVFYDKAFRLWFLHWDAFVELLRRGFLLLDFSVNFSRVFGRDRLSDRTASFLGHTLDHARGWRSV